ncbi:hypothetical protein P43SY_000476 [Pythium insidiosum]|uniref:Elicitin-like protein n=1 Tax=Pythium insidiosum TaxID=114742 RepID=A0AAD5LIY5_PYTIN|nr:hypothetical protein P43SY_000476 [Pythium insidiosum]
MKVLYVIGVIVSALALTTPAHAAECTQDQTLELLTVITELSENPECNKITVSDPSVKDLCKFPGCAAAFKAKLDKFPDCTANGENVRLTMASITKCNGSSSSTASMSTLAVAGAVLATALVAVIA